ncbi:hypothetical protein FBU30_003571 [Linnemannia zychae]|nr:hypothetical protein FBU30_003571 [Linnemannia zychae]
MNGNNSAPFTFHIHIDSQSLRNQLPQSANNFSGNTLYNGEGEHSGGGRKRKSSYEDISPLAMKTRTGIGLEEEIVYDRTMTMMMAGQKRLQKEQEQLQQQQQQFQQQQLQIQQQIHQQQLQIQQQGSSADALCRFFMVGKNQAHSNSSPSRISEQQAPTFADCAGEFNGCETNKVPGMRDRYQAIIRPCTFCGRPECQFCVL